VFNKKGKPSLDIPFDADVSEALDDGEDDHTYGPNCSMLEERLALEKQKVKHPKMDYKIFDAEQSSIAKSAENNLVANELKGLWLIFVKALNGITLPIPISSKALIGDLKQAIFKLQGIPLNFWRLTTVGGTKVLEDNVVIDVYLANLSTVEQHMALPGGKGKKKVKKTRQENKIADKVVKKLERTHVPVTKRITLKPVPKASPQTRPKKLPQSRMAVAPVKKELQIQKKREVSEYERVARAFTDPRDYPPIRVRTQINSMACAAHSLGMEIPASWPPETLPSGHTALELNQDEMIFAVYKQPECAVIQSAYVDGKTWEYDIYGETVNDSDQPLKAPTPPSLDFYVPLRANVWNPVPMQFATYNGGTTNPMDIHGQVLFGRTISGKPDEPHVLFGHKGEIFELEMLGIPVFTGSDMQFWLSLNYVEEGVIKKEIQVIGPAATPTPSSATFSFRLANTGYFNFDINPIVDSSTTEAEETMIIEFVNVKLIGDGTSNGPSQVFRHLALPEWNTKALDITKILVYAGSGRYTNTASPLEKQGYWIGRQLDGDKPWFHYIKRFDDLAAQSDVADHLLNKGAHGWIKINDDAKELTYDTFTYTRDGRIHNTFAPIMGQKPYNLWYGKLTPNTSSVNGVVYYGWGTNELTQSRWIETKKPHITIETMKAYLSAMSDIPEWHENPTHMREIGKKITTTAKSFLSTATKMAPSVIQGLELLTAFL